MVVWPRNITVAPEEGTREVNTYRKTTATRTRFRKREARATYFFGHASTELSGLIIWNHWGLMVPKRPEAIRPLELHFRSEHGKT